MAPDSSTDPLPLAVPERRSIGESEPAEPVGPHGGTTEQPEPGKHSASGARRPSLRRHRDFTLLWGSQAVSAVGSQVTTLALPLTAVVYLHATVAQVGLLTAARELAFLGLMLLFGVLVDRVRRCRLMIAADLARSAALTAVPVLAWVHALAMPVLYAAAFAVGALTVIFDLAYRAFLPSIVGPEDLLAANSRLQATASIAEVAGPGLAGALIQLLRAPFALLVDAGSFLFSATTLALVRSTERIPRPVGGQRRSLRTVFADIRAGLRFTFHHPILGPLAGAAATFNFFSQLMLTLIVVHAARQLAMSSGQIGLVFAGFGAGGTLAATTLDRALRRLGYGRLLLTGYALGILALAGLPVVSGSAAVATTLLTAVFFCAGVGIVALNIVEMTLRQAATPNSGQGRMNASFRFLIGALSPLAALAAGLTGQSIGLHQALIAAAAGAPLSILWLVRSSVRHVRTLEDLPA